MNPYDPTALIRTLNSRPEVFICGPSRGSSKSSPKTHLRVYANGGLLCNIPTEEEDLILPPSSGYLKYVLQESREKLQEEYHTVFTDGTNNLPQEIPLENERRAGFLMDETRLKLLLDAIENKYEKKYKSLKSSEDKSSKERRNQTVIARNHRDFQDHKKGFPVPGQSAPKEYFTVVCDFEMTIPGSWYQRGTSLPGFPGETKRPKCDLVAFSCTQDVSDPWLISIIELKCNRRACQNEKSGLSAHARDMAVCRKETGDAPNQSDYILEILRRLSCMLRYRLLENVPEGLEAEINRLLPKSWTNQEQMRQSREKVRSRGVSLRSCFLFTGDDDIRADDNRTDRSEDAVSLCQEAEYLKDHPEDYFYQFREDPSDVDLSDMESWSSFSSSAT